MFINTKESLHNSSGAGIITTTCCIRVEVTFLRRWKKGLLAHGKKISGWFPRIATCIIFHLYFFFVARSMCAWTVEQEPPYRRIRLSSAIQLFTVLCPPLEVLYTKHRIWKAYYKICKKLTAKSVVRVNFEVLKKGLGSRKGFKQSLKDTGISSSTNQSEWHTQLLYKLCGQNYWAFSWDPSPAYIEIPHLS